MRVLIIDDDHGLLRILRLAFSSAGHDVETLDGGLGAIARLAGHAPHTRPDACIVDNYMPAMSGIDIIRLAAATPAAAVVPIVLYSSDRTLADVVPDLRHPCARFVLKGTPIIDLVKVVEQASASASGPAEEAR